MVVGGGWWWSWLWCRGGRCRSKGGRRRKETGIVEMSDHPCLENPFRSRKREKKKGRKEKEKEGKIISLITKQTKSQKTKNKLFS